MAASKQDIAEWFDEGLWSGATHMVIICDTFDYDDYPVFVGGSHVLAHNGSVQEIVTGYDGQNMQKIMEVYDLSMDKDVQLNESRAYHL